MPSSHRVVQWTTGNIGKRSAAAIASYPTFERAELAVRPRAVTATPPLAAGSAMAATAQDIVMDNDLALVLPWDVVPCERHGEE